MCDRVFPDAPRLAPNEVPPPLSATPTSRYQDINGLSRWVQFCVHRSSWSLGLRRMHVDNVRRLQSCNYGQSTLIAVVTAWTCQGGWFERNLCCAWCDDSCTGNFSEEQSTWKTKVEWWTVLKFIVNMSVMMFGKQIPDTHQESSETLSKNRWENVCMCVKS